MQFNSRLSTDERTLLKQTLAGRCDVKESIKLKGEGVHTTDK